MKIKLLNITKFIKTFKYKFYFLENKGIYFLLTSELGSYKRFLSNSFIFIKQNRFYIYNKRLFNSYFFTLSNYVLHSANGFFIELSLVGLGYKTHKIKNHLFLDLNFSHKIYYPIPVGVFIRCSKKKILLFGLNKVLVFNTAKEIKNFRTPNKYKGTGIRYLGENIKLRPGKQR